MLFPSRAPKELLRNERLAKDLDLLGYACQFLGGNENTRWTITVDTGLRGVIEDNRVDIPANGKDIFLCNAWLFRAQGRPDCYIYNAMPMINLDMQWRGALES